MAGYSGVWTPAKCAENPPYELERNKFVFVNRNREHTIVKPSTVLINPHFKENKTVFLNPNFQPKHNNNNIKGPKVYINPNVLKSISSATRPVSINGNYAIGNPSIVNFRNLTSGGPMSTEGKRDAVVESQIGHVQTFPKPTPIDRANCFQTHRPNLFCKINSSKDTHKGGLAKNFDVPQKPRSREMSALEPVAPQKAEVCTTNRVNSNQELNPPIHSRNLVQSQRMIHTRTKIVNNQNTLIFPMRKQKSQQKSLSTRFKYIRQVEASPPLDIKKSESPKTTTRNAQKRDIANTSARRNSIITRFKYIRNGAKLIKINKSPMKSKYKIVNDNISNKSVPVRKTKISSSPYRKKYVYLNKFNSSSFLANNVILKNSKRRNLIKINGILYQNSPCLLKRASLSSKTNQSSSGSKGRNPVRTLVKCQGKYKIVRSQLASAAKLKKSNMACSIYKKTGKCNGQKTGACIKVHNPDQIILCKRFLQGVCVNDKCLLSHKVSSEKMPTCKYFLEGHCNKSECQYLHVKISPNADICKDFLEGFCKEGVKCDKRHQFLCPEFEKSQKCSKPKCEYPHGTFEIKPKPERKKFKKIISRKSVKKTPKRAGEEIAENCQIRYYKENSDEVEKNTLKRTVEEEDVVFPKRQKLGSLPSFIPIG